MSLVIMDHGHKLEKNLKKNTQKLKNFKLEKF